MDKSDWYRVNGGFIEFGVHDDRFPDVSIRIANASDQGKAEEELHKFLRCVAETYPSEVPVAGSYNANNEALRKRVQELEHDLQMTTHRTD